MSDEDWAGNGRGGARMSRDGRTDHFMPDQDAADRGDADRAMPELDWTGGAAGPARHARAQAGMRHAGWPDRRDAATAGRAADPVPDPSDLGSSAFLSELAWPMVRRLEPRVPTGAFHHAPPAGTRSPMIQRKDKQRKAPPESRKADAAFDLWLQRGLHEIYDEVAKEPIPEALLKLIKEDRDQ